MTLKALLQFSVLSAALVSAAQAEVRLPKVLGSHMVLQRERPIRIWGWSDPREKVSVTLGSANSSAVGDTLGQWSVSLPPQRAGGPFQLSVQGANRVVLEDILIGDVWFASGQSNMEMPLAGFPGSAVVKDASQEIARANHPDIRLLLVKRKASSYPLNNIDTEAGWTACAPESAAKFSAVAYFFGRGISEQEHVPVGLIDSTWGGTPAEAWMSLNGIAADPGLMPVFAARAEMIDEQSNLEATIAAEKRDDAEARARNLPPPKHSWHPGLDPWDPSWLYNGMVAPFTPFAIRGVIWYQGESNSGSARAPLYSKLFPAMIADWRKHWGQGLFPFLFVQIANFNAGPKENWPLVREAQRRTLSLTNTAMAVTIDIGDPDNVHPSDKQTAGARLALAARALSYHENVEYSGPAFREASLENSGIRVWFDHAAGLTAKGGAPRDFEVAAADRRFVPATARIEGESILVASPQVEHPEYVRYGWQNVPAVNLYNSAGLPASPFSSEPSFVP